MFGKLAVLVVLLLAETASLAGGPVPGARRRVLGQCGNGQPCVISAGAVGFACPFDDADMVGSGLCLCSDAQCTVTASGVFTGELKVSINEDCPGGVPGAHVAMHLLGQTETGVGFEASTAEPLDFCNADVVSSCNGGDYRSPFFCTSSVPSFANCFGSLGCTLAETMLPAPDWLLLHPLPASMARTVRAAFGANGDPIIIRAEQCEPDEGTPDPSDGLPVTRTYCIKGHLAQPPVPLADCDPGTVCTASQPLPSEGSVLGATTGADPNGRFAASCGGDNAPEILFDWLPDRSGLAVFSTMDLTTNFSAMIYVLAGPCASQSPNGFTELACAAGGGSSPDALLACGPESSCCSPGASVASVLDFDGVEAGKSYCVVVDSYFQEAGIFGLHVGFCPEGQIQIDPSSGSRYCAAPPPGCTGGATDTQIIGPPPPEPSPPPVSCTSRCCRSSCGDGERDPGEECDVGNTVAGDGCSGCRREATYQCSQSVETACGAPSCLLAGGGTPTCCETFDQECAQPDGTVCLANCCREPGGRTCCSEFGNLDLPNIFCGAELEGSNCLFGFGSACCETVDRECTKPDGTVCMDSNTAPGPSGGSCCREPGGRTCCREAFNNTFFCDEPLDCSTGPLGGVCRSQPDQCPECRYAAEPQCGLSRMLCFQRKRWNGASVERDVSLSDYLGGGQYAVATRPPTALCLPAGERLPGGLLEDPVDPKTALASYKIKPTQSSVQMSQRIRLTDEVFPQGIVLDLGSTTSLLVPTATAEAGPASPPDPLSHGVDHYRCAKVSVAQGFCAHGSDSDSTCDRDLDCGDLGPCITHQLFPQRGSTFSTTLGTRALKAARITRLCIATSLDGSTLVDNRLHLACYRVAEASDLCATDQTASCDRSHHEHQLSAANTFGTGVFHTTTQGELCVPARVQLYFSPTCNDGIKDQDETDVDCGGTLCGPCSGGRLCKSGADCETGTCSSGVCTSCTAENPGCTADLEPCGLPSDCASGHCQESTIPSPCSPTGRYCIPAQCFDGVADTNPVGFDESDVDCGSACNIGCANGKTCFGSCDCISGNCTGGLCAARCRLGFGDCDANPKNGCETDLRTDSNCGGCGIACAQDSSCLSGRCVPCNTGFGDCDGNSQNGCEMDLRTDPSNCGACGNVCAAGSICDAGQCLTTCTAGPCEGRVLIVGAEDLIPNAEVQAKLVGTGAFTTVDVFNAGAPGEVVPGGGTPSLATLQNYAAVLVYSDLDFADPVALGDNLANYFDAGGRVVVTTFANTTTLAHTTLRGRFGTVANGYVLIQPAAADSSPEPDPLVIVEPESPLVAGVTTLTASQGLKSTGTVVNGGVVVAEWGSGAPLIVRGLKDGRPLVELNMYPPSGAVFSSLWVGDGATIMKNALLY